MDPSGVLGKWACIGCGRDYDTAYLAPIRHRTTLGGRDAVVFGCSLECIGTWEADRARAPESPKEAT